MKEVSTNDLEAFVGFIETPLCKFYVKLVESETINMGVALLKDTGIPDAPTKMAFKQGYVEGIRFFAGILNDSRAELQHREQLATHVDGTA